MDQLESVETQEISNNPRQNIWNQVKTYGESYLC